jgi:hypothetical protein
LSQTPSACCPTDTHTTPGSRPNIRQGSGRPPSENGRAPDRYVGLDAENIVIGGVYTRHGFRLTGTMNLYNATVNGPVDLESARIDNPGEIAFGGWASPWPARSPPKAQYSPVPSTRGPPPSAATSISPA